MRSSGSDVNVIAHDATCFDSIFLTVESNISLGGVSAKQAFRLARPKNSSSKSGQLPLSMLQTSSSNHDLGNAYLPTVRGEETQYCSAEYCDLSHSSRRGELPFCLASAYWNAGDNLWRTGYAMLPSARV